MLPKYLLYSTLASWFSMVSTSYRNFTDIVPSVRDA
jgi:hypothetical protein